MKNTIFIYDYMQNGEALYEYIKNNDTDGLLKKARIVYVPFRINKTILDKVRRVFELGIFNLIRCYLTKKSIIVSTSPAKFQTLISNNIVCINHGWATKKTPGNNEILDDKKMEYYSAYKKSCKNVVCLSEFDSTYYLECEALNNIKKPKFIPLGIPRNDYFFKYENYNDIINNLNNKFGIDNRKKTVYLYAPTHRELPELNENLLNRLIKEFEAIDKELEKHQKILLFRPHYFSTEIKERLNEFKNIYYAGYDEYPETRDLMIYSDVLITDYSSIFVDYLLLEKPIIFYSFDLNQYEELRGLVIDYNNNIHTPGPKINNLYEILSLEESDFKKYNLSKSKDFFHKYSDGKSAERLYKFLINQV